MKRHIKRINAPSTWKILRKATRFIRRPNPGAHSFMLGTSLFTVFKEVDTIATNARETRAILNNQEVFINGKRVKNPDYLVGFMDIITIPKINYCKKMNLNPKGHLVLEELDPKKADELYCKLTGKRMAKGKLQLSFLNGKTWSVSKNENKIGDTMVFSIKDKKIIKTLELKKDAKIILHAGKKKGIVAKVADIKDKVITLEKDGKKFETKKEYAFVIE